MPKSLRFRHVLVTALLAVTLLGQETWALAGTTGGLSGSVVDASSGAAVANATVIAQSPAQTTTTKTDASGHFIFISLAPDTYAVSATKNGYDSASVAGVVVFADSVQAVSIGMRPALKTIASVRSTAQSSLVKSGTTADVYSVSASTQDKISALGGGGSLNSAYAAVASVPGVVMPLNQTGYFQTVHIRGGDYDQVGYEFDGVPVNRSFDNYPSGALSSLGMSELQVYTGATPASSEGQGLAGYINQVIKTGTFPGFANAALALGGPTFYHKASIEAGGASPNRLFSYYAGIGGYDQGFRYTNNNNASEYASISPALAVLTPPDPNPSYNPSLFNFEDPATYPCQGAAQDVNYAACYANGVTGPAGYQLAPYNWGQLADLADRDAVVNLHFGLPHKYDAGRDDVQILWDSALLHNSFYESTNDAGGAAYYALSSGAPTYLDGFSYNGPVGSVLPASQIPQYMSLYMYPSQMGHAFQSTIPANARDTMWNDQEIVKLQYQKNFGSDAYFRIYGYTYYSDWLQNGPVCAFSSFGCAVSPDYELSSHTRGMSAQFADQLSAQHLLSVQANYTTANSVRDNNTQMSNAASASRSRFAVLVDGNNPTSGICYQANATVAVPTTCLNTASGDVRATWLTWSQAYDAAHGGAALPNYSGVTCGTGACSWLVAENSSYATYNQVVPKFTAFSLSDQWRPDSKVLLNLGLRVDRFEFDGADTKPNDPARAFWFKAFNLDNCVDANGNLVPISTPGVCPAGTSPANLTNVSGQTNTYTHVEPRVSGTYTLNSDNVLRFSYGKYVEPPNAAYEQYNVQQENLAQFLGSNFYNYGFTTPGHQVRPPVSDNYDLSWEKRLRGTDWSFKVTPFLRKTKDQIQNFFLDQTTGFISGLNVGRQTSKGVEFEVNKGDFNRDGLSGMFSFTYTHSYINYDTLQNGTSIVSQINDNIKTYNAYTSFCASNPGDARCGQTTSKEPGSACYDGAAAGVTCTNPGAIANPYWNAPVQNLLQPDANYPTYDIFPGGVGGSANSFAVPYAATLVLNYKREKFSATPSFQLLGGNRYGSPESMVGVDPAAGCASLGTSPANDPRYPYGNGGQTGAGAYDAMTCAGVIPVPNTFTGTFDQPGAFVNPTQFLMNLQVSYELSPKITLVGTAANLINTCFGGTKEPWRMDDRNVCSYGINNSAGAIPPETNVYNPSAAFMGPQRLVQYPYGAYLGGVNVDGNSSKNPLNLYLEARMRF
jgi:TonB dependent receptor/Carboxypeptidase regulatory-like domain/TonB-dependent Receptor Plug Domain